MNKEDFIQEVKMEWLNDEVELDTDEETVEARAYARGWNACQKEILNNIDKAFSNKEVE